MSGKNYQNYNDNVKNCPTNLGFVQQKNAQPDSRPTVKKISQTYCSPWIKSITSGRFWLPVFPKLISVSWEPVECAKMVNTDRTIVKASTCYCLRASA